MNNTDVPIWLKYSLTLEEASKYFRIGEKKLRRLVEENPDADWFIMNGNRIQIMPYFIFHKVGAAAARHSGSL